MTLMTTGARSGATATRDRSVVTVLLLMLALVFGPAIGLHVAVNLLGAGPARTASSRPSPPRRPGAAGADPEGVQATPIMSGRPPSTQAGPRPAGSGPRRRAAARAPIHV